MRVPNKTKRSSVQNATNIKDHNCLRMGTDVKLPINSTTGATVRTHHASSTLTALGQGGARHWASERKFTIQTFTVTRFIVHIRSSTLSRAAAQLSTIAMPQKGQAE